jgi:hypothetical protein
VVYEGVGKTRVSDARCSEPEVTGGSGAYARVGHDVRDAGRVRPLGSHAHFVGRVRADGVPNRPIS